MIQASAFESLNGGHCTLYRHSWYHFERFHHHNDAESQFVAKQIPKRLRVGLPRLIKISVLKGIEVKA